MSTLYIIRGLPGSGKTTLANKLVSPERVREADTYFVNEFGDYIFDPEQLKYAHEWCLVEVLGMLQGHSREDCAVSNTFSRRWEYEKYEKYAELEGYDVQVIECHGDWANTHGVPAGAIKRMKERWEPHR
jgi:adenylate kinase